MEKIELKTKLRSTVGNGPARALRREGFTPAVLYGPDTETIKLSVPTHRLELITKASNIGQMLLNLVIEGDKVVTKTAMIRELQTHPLSGNVIHADFYEVDMSRKIIVSVPVVAIGNAKGVEMGGMLQLVRRELEVLCLPDEIPEAIEVDITDLEIGDSLHVEEIETGDNIEIPADVNFTVLTILAPSAEEEVQEGEAEEGAEAEADEEAGEAADEA